MKFRTDFVTNSSSSSFSVEIEVVGPNDKRVWVEIDPTATYTHGASFNVANLKTLTGIDSVSELAKALTDSVVLLDYLDEESGEECPNESLKKLSQKYDDESLADMAKELDDFEISVKNNFFNASVISHIVITQYHKAWGEFVEDYGTVGLLTKVVKRKTYKNGFGNATEEEEWESVIMHIRSGCIFSYTSDSSDMFKGKSFVITGFQQAPEDLKYIIEECGGTVVNTISGNVDYLICSDLKSASEETQIAMELNIPIITDVELDMITEMLCL